MRLVHRKTGLSPPVKYFTDRSKVELLLWVFYVFGLVFAMPLYASVYMCLVVTCWKRADSWLSNVMSNCEFATFHWYPGSGLVLDCIDY